MPCFVYDFKMKNEQHVKAGSWISANNIQIF